MLLRISDNTQITIDGEAFLVKGTGTRVVNAQGLCDQVTFFLSRCRDSEKVTLEVGGFAISDRDLSGFVQLMVNG